MSSQSARAAAPVRRPTGLTGDPAWSPHCRRCSSRPSASLPAPGSRSWNARARSACPLHARGQALACGGRHGRRPPARHTRRLRCAGSRLRSARHAGRRGDANRRAAHIRLRRRQWAAIAFLVAARESNDGRYRRWHSAFKVGNLRLRGGRVVGVDAHPPIGQVGVAVAASLPAYDLARFPDQHPMAGEGMAYAACTGLIGLRRRAVAAAYKGCLASAFCGTSASSAYRLPKAGRRRRAGSRRAGPVGAVSRFASGP